MTNEKDLELIQEYEELIILLKQLHEDTPVLEKQHKSIQEAFVSAQTKLEKTISSSNTEIKEVKEKILNEFRQECDEIFSESLESAKKQTEAMIKKIKSEEKNISELITRAEEASKRLSEVTTNIPLTTSKTSTRTYKDNLVDGDIYTGEELVEKFIEHIDEDLFVKRIVAKTGKPWSKDYCMLVTGSKGGSLCGEIYDNGILTKEYMSYSLDDKYMIYRGPSEKKILKSR